MSSKIGDNVTYYDGEGKARGALVLFADNDKRETNLAAVTNDSQKYSLLNSADFAHGLERKFTVPNAQRVADELAKERQKQADASCTEENPEGAEQPGVTSAEVFRDTYTEKGQNITLATAPFSPSAAAKAKFAKAEGAST